MKWIKCLLLVVVMITTFAAYAAAGCDANADRGDFTITAQSRYRLEMDGRSFIPDANSDWMQYMRTRVGIKAHASENAGLFVQFQDSRILGDNPGTEFFNNNTMEETGIHQAYLWYKPCDMGWVKAGRMSVSMHNERLVGKYDWDNTGRTEEGIMFGHKLGDNVGFTAAVWQLEENNFDDVETGDRLMDPMFYVFNLNFSEQQFDLFAYLWKDEYLANAKLWTFGVYSQRTFADTWFYDAMFALQTGSDDVVDYSGMLINAEIGDEFANGFKVSALVDYTTGDDPETVDEVETFNNLLYSGHKWNGYMDYFVGGLSYGLMDFAIKLYYPLEKGWSLSGTGHSFSTAEDYDTADGTSSSIGTEFDFGVRKTDGPFAVQAGLGIFSPNSDWSDGDSGTWGYVQGTVNY